VGAERGIAKQTAKATKIDLESNKTEKVPDCRGIHQGANTIDEILTGPAEQAKILMENRNTLILGADTSRLEA